MTSRPSRGRGLGHDRRPATRRPALGLTPDTDPVVIVDRPYVEICLQEVDPPPVTKTPLHLDVVTDDSGAEVRRLVGLGAAIRQQFEMHTWMRDPKGNDCCVVDV